MLDKLADGKIAEAAADYKQFKKEEQEYEEALKAEEMRGEFS